MQDKQEAANTNQTAAQSQNLRLLPMRLYTGSYPNVPGGPSVPHYETAKEWNMRLFAGSLPIEDWVDTICKMGDGSVLKFADKIVAAEQETE